MTGQANLEAGIKHKVAAGTGHIESSPAMDGCGVSSEQASHEQQQSVMTENNSNLQEPSEVNTEIQKD